MRCQLRKIARGKGGRRIDDFGFDRNAARRLSSIDPSVIENSVTFSAWDWGGGADGGDGESGESEWS
jgi:hypothetical protein